MAKIPSTRNLRILHRSLTWQERFLFYAQPKAVGCWEWGAGRKPNGYGHFNAGAGKLKYAHRLSFEFFKGPIPAGLVVCHHCDNRGCVNPDHLFASTIAGNQLDMVQKGRQCRGEKTKNSKVTEADVRAIRKDERHVDDICRTYGIARRTVYYIKSGKLWAHIPRTSFSM